MGSNFYSSFLLSLIVIYPNIDIVSGNYRHYHIENADICKSVEIGTGAMILQLDNPLKIQPDYDNKGRNCEINLKAPPHFGIMVCSFFHFLVALFSKIKQIIRV